MAIGVVVVLAVIVISVIEVCQSFHVIQNAAHSKWMDPLLSAAEKRKRKLSVKAAA